MNYASEANEEHIGSAWRALLSVPVMPCSAPRHPTPTLASCRAIHPPSSYVPTHLGYIGLFSCCCVRFVGFGHESYAVVLRVSGVSWANPVAFLHEGVHIWIQEWRNCNAPPWGTGKGSRKMPQDPRFTSLLTISPSSCAQHDGLQRSRSPDSGTIDHGAGRSSTVGSTAFIHTKTRRATIPQLTWRGSCDSAQDDGIV